MFRSLANSLSLVGFLKSERRDTRDEAKSNSNHSSGTAFGAIRFHNGSVRCGVSLQLPPHGLKLILWTSVFRSKQFVFVVGENQAAFTVHAAIIAKQSKALDVLINGSMGEAFEGKAIFEDIEEDTFIRFCQFAYTGDYTTPDFTHIATIELPDISPPAAISYDASTTDRDDGRSMKPEPELEPAPAPVDDFGWGSMAPKAKKPEETIKG